MSLGAQTNAGPIGAALEKIEGRPASDPLALIKQVESLSSDSDERLRILDQIDSQSFERLDAQRKYYVWFLRGSVYRLQGNRDQAIQCLKKGLEYFSEKSAMAWRVLEELQDPWRHAERWSVSKIKDVTPVYPLDAKRDRIEGVVSLECIIGYRGQVTDVRIVSGISALNQAAIDAVKQWRYERLHNWSDPPALLTVPVVFSLSACSMEPPVVPNIGRDAVKGEPAASIQQPLDSLIVEPLIKALGDSNSSGKLPAPVPAAAPKNRAIRVDWVGDKNTLPNDRNMLEEVTSANTLPIGSVVRLYSSSLPYLMTPGWFKGWRKVLDIHFNKKRIHFVNLDDGTEEDRLFGDTFGGHIRCYTVPADFDASTSRTNRTAISSVDASSLSADALIDYIVEHRTDGDILSLCSSMVEKLQYGFYSQPEDIEKALRTFGDSGMAARFEQIRRTMKPSDLHPLITQVLGRYLKRCERRREERTKAAV
jgi:TonB family protein